MIKYCLFSLRIYICYNKYYFCRKKINITMSLYFIEFKKKKITLILILLSALAKLADDYRV